jgi:hypothetical protein
VNVELLELELERKWEKAALQAYKREEREGFIKWLIVVIGVSTIIVWACVVLKP